MFLSRTSEPSVNAGSTKVEIFFLTNVAMTVYTENRLVAVVAGGFLGKSFIDLNRNDTCAIGWFSFSNCVIVLIVRFGQ